MLVSGVTARENPMRTEFKGLVGLLALLLAACGGPTPLVTPDGGDRIAANNPAPSVDDNNERRLAILNGQMVTVLDPTPQDVQALKSETAPASEQQGTTVAAIQPDASVSADVGVGSRDQVIATGFPSFTAAIGASLRDSLEQYLQANGWRLSWRAEGSSPGRVRDFRLVEPVSIQPESIVGLLNQLLVGRGLHATVSNKSKAVLIENDANALPRVKRED